MKSGRRCLLRNLHHHPHADIAIVRLALGDGAGVGADGPGGAGSAGTGDDQTEAGVPYPEVVMVVRDRGKMSVFLRQDPGIVEVQKGEVWMDWLVKDIRQTEVDFWRESETFGFTAFAPIFDKVEDG